MRGLRRRQISVRQATRIDVPEARCFVGLDAYQSVIAHSDVVLLATPPHFRPMHLQAAIAAGKHVFAEKPVAVDATGALECQAARIRSRHARPDEGGLANPFGVERTGCSGRQE